MRRALTATALAALLVDASRAHANPIVTRCNRLTPKQSAELEARAELTLSTLERRDGAIIIECDQLVSVLTWFDGTRRKIDEGNGLIEGALDAIEEQAALGERKRRATDRVYFDEPNLAPSSPSPKAETRPAPPKITEETEGGIGLAMTFEPWSGAAGLGPRLDIGLAIGHGFALVGGEGVRFGVDGNGNNMVFDLVGGIGFGAPYCRGQGLGLVLLGGVERFAGARASDTLWIWSGVVSLGIRGAARAGPFALWAGVDGMVRTSEVSTGGPDVFGLPANSVLFSLGGFWSAWPFSLAPRAGQR